MCMFCRSLFVLLFFFFWPLCCLFFFDIRGILIIPSTSMVSSNSSYQREVFSLPISGVIGFKPIIISQMSYLVEVGKFCSCFTMKCWSLWDNVITPTLNTPTVITPTLSTSTVTDSLCNSGAFSNPNAVRDCPFNLKGVWFLSRSRKFFSYAALLFLKLFSAAQQNIVYKRKYYFM